MDRVLGHPIVLVVSNFVGVKDLFVYFRLDVKCEKGVRQGNALKAAIVNYDKYKVHCSVYTKCIPFVKSTFHVHILRARAMLLMSTKKVRTGYQYFNRAFRKVQMFPKSTNCQIFLFRPRSFQITWSCDADDPAILCE